MKRCLVLCLLLFAMQHGRSQVLSNYRYYGAESELASRHVKCVMQDSKGMMWLGTQGGLNRFDGKDFLLFTAAAGSEKLSGTVIQSLVEDNHGNLLVGSEGGIDRVNLVTFQVRKVPIKRYLAGASYDLESFFKTRSGIIYAWLNNNVLVRIDDDNKVTQILVESKGRRSKNVNWMSEDDLGTVWISSSDGSIYTIKPGARHVNLFTKLDFEVHGVANTRSLGLVITAIDGFYKYDHATQQFKRVFPEIGRCTIVKEDRNGCVWISSLFRRLYKIYGGVVTDETMSLRIYEEFNYGINCVEFDKKDNVWVGTNFGLVKFTSSPKNFGVYFFADQGLVERVNTSTRNITEDTKTGDIYFASYSGIFRINHATKKIDSVWLDSRKQIIPYALLYDNDQLLIGTEGNGFYWYDTKRNMMHHDSALWNPDKTPLANTFLISLYKDHDGLIWVGDYTGLILYDRKANVLREHHYEFGGYRLDRTRINHIFCSYDNHLWIGTDAGLFEFNEKRVPVNRFSTDNGLPANYVKCMEEDVNHNLWIGTVNGGIAQYNRALGTFAAYNKTHGLADNDVNGIVRSGVDVLWISTQNGLSRLNLERMQFDNFRTEDGLTTNEFNSNSFFRSANGDVYFGSINGIITIPSNDILAATDSSALVLTQLSLHNPEGDVLKNWLDNGTPIEVPYNTQYFEIRFALTNYINPERTTYSYLIEGVMNRWEYLGSQNSLRFYNLPPGTHKLRIRATSNNARAAGQELMFPLVIEQAYYTTWWFIALVLLAIAGIAYAAVTYRIRQLQRVAEVRTNLSSDLHDDVGSILTRVALQAELARRNAHEQDKGILTSIAETCRTAVSNMKDVIWSTDARNDQFSNLVDRMHEHATNMLEPVDKDYTLQVYCADEEMKLSMETRQHLYLVFKEAINNIVKHSNATMVEIELKVSDRNLYLSVSDNGNSHEDKLSTGSGLRNMEMRAARMGAKISITRDNGYRIQLTKRL